jgi:hypothetical protein
MMDPRLACNHAAVAREVAATVVTQEFAGKLVATV